MPRRQGRPSRTHLSRSIHIINKRGTHIYVLLCAYVGKGRVRRHENGAAVGANHLCGVRAVLVPGAVSAVIEAAGVQAVDADRGEYLH